METITAQFDGRVFIPQQPINLRAGSVVQLVLTAPTEAAPKPLAALAELMDQFPVEDDLPTDAAAQHDHYLYGTPKRP